MAAMHIWLILHVKICSLLWQYESGSESPHFTIDFSPWVLTCLCCARLTNFHFVNMGSITSFPSPSNCEGDDCGELVGLFIAIPIFVTIVCCCFAIGAGRCGGSRTELGQNPNMVLSSSNGIHTGRQGHTGYTQRSSVYWRHPYPYNNSFTQSSSRTLIRAPSRPSQTSRQPDDHEAEILLRDLSQITHPEDDKRVCSICLDSLSYTTTVEGSCCHPVHTRCLNHWIQTTRTRSCPVCRKGLLANEGE